MVEAFEGSRVTLTMVPTIRSFMDAHRLADVTVVADAGMISAANQRAIEEAGLSFILGARIPDTARPGGSPTTRLVLNLWIAVEE
jgi:transposase